MRHKHFCSVCNEKAFSRVNRQEDYYCIRHYTQVREYGKIIKIERKRLNEIIEKKDYCIMYLYGRDGKKIDEVLFDKNKRKLLEGERWFKHSRYAAMKDGNNIVTMQSLLKGYKKGFVVDHINRKPLDNRMINLRFATRSQNAMNRSGKQCGINWYKDRGKWEVRISINKKEKHLGYYKDYSEALKVRINAELKYYKVFSPNY